MVDRSDCNVGNTLGFSNSDWHTYAHDWHFLLACVITAVLRGDWHMHVLDARFLLAYTPWPMEVSRFHTMDDSESQNEHTQLSQKNTPNASDGDTNANELSEKTEKAAMFMNHNPLTEIMLIPKSKFVELFKGNTNFGYHEVIYQNIAVVLKVELPETTLQGGTI